MRVVERLAETLAPGQGEDLLRMAQLDPHAVDDEALNQTIDNEMVQNLKQIYNLYVEQKMPFVEQVRLLSLLPRSWYYEKIMQIFSCSRHMVKTAHRMHDENEYMLNRDKEPAIRERADPDKIRHFVSWLVESNTLVSGSLFILRSTFVKFIFFLPDRYIRSHHSTYGQWRQVRVAKANSTVSADTCSCRLQEILR